MARTADNLLEEFLRTVREKYKDRINDFLMPPPVFWEMQGEFLAMDLENGSLTARFPILKKYLNPYGTMQGGMIAAAVDNTVGPLSIAIAPPNVTRTLELKYSQPVLAQMEYIVVQARLVERHEPKLTFEAKVLSPSGVKLVTCKALHWIIENSSKG
jgi:acyl-coenzyme A thioesterase PaaI-like protein